MHEFIKTCQRVSFGFAQTCGYRIVDKQSGLASQRKTTKVLSSVN